jgi:uncharacterized protein (TIGR00251 family)
LASSPLRVVLSAPLTNLPPFLRQQSDGTLLLSVKLQPRASADAICETLGSALKIKITAPPVDSAANEALIRFLSETLGCPRNAVRIVRGATSRHKSIALIGLGAQTVTQRLVPPRS